MKRLFLILFSLIYVLHLSAQGTDVFGPVNGAVWDSTGNPYRVVGDVDIQNLVINPGVDIIITGNYLFRISGFIAAEGTKKDSIRFLGGGWQGILFDTASVSSRLKYCSITGAATGIQNIESSIFLSNCRIYQATGNGVEVQSGTVRLERCLIERNGAHGILVTGNGSATLVNGIIRQNTQNGLRTNQGSLDLTNTIISSNTQGGIFLANTADVLSFENCSIVDHSGGPGIVLTAAAIVTGVNSILYFNTVSVGFVSGNVTIDYSDIEGLASYSGGGSNNFDQDPLFTDTQTYSLNANSPCVDAGNPAAQYNDICFPPGLGTQQNDAGVYGGPGGCLWFDPLAFSPTTLSFGNVSISDTATVSVLFKNYRDTSLSITSLQINGTNATNFSVATTGFNLAPFDSLRRDVRFSPDASGGFSAQLIANGNFGQLSLDLSGNGVIPDIDVDPLNIAYGNVRVADSVSANIIITNVGVGNLKIIAISIDPEYFAVSHFSLPHIIAPFTSDTISAVFKPDSAGSFNGSVQILSNDPDESTITVTLDGTGIAAKISAGSDTLDVGSVNVLSDTLVQVLISNLGNDTLFVASGSVLDPQNLFSLTGGQFPFQIAPGGAPRSVEIAYAPLSAGVHSATLRLVNNDPKRSIFDVPVRGTGIAPEFDIDSELIAFGEVVVGAVRRDSVIIRNIGTAPLAVSWDPLENAGGVFTLIDPPDNIIVAPNNSYFIHLSFTPIDTGSVSAVLPIFSNDPDRDSLRIDISGTGIRPIFNLTIDSLQFGSVLIFANSTQSIDLSNSGTGSLVIDTAFTFLGVGSPFIVESDFPIIVPAFSPSLQLFISFQPSVRGLVTDTLYISTNDPENSLNKVVLRGLGIAPTIELSIADIIFNTTLVTETSFDSLSIRNTGEGDLFLIGAEFISGAFASFTVNTIVDSLIVPAGDSVSLSLAFTPSAGGQSSDSLVIQSTDPGNPRIAIYAEGTALYDITPAQIQVLSSFDTLATNRSFVYEVSIQDDEALIQQVYLNLRNGGQSTYQRFNLIQRVPDIWNILFPEDIISVRGIEYYLQVFHGGAITNLGTRDEPQEVVVHVEQFPFPFRTPENKYRMVSLPLNSDNQTLSDLFEDDLGPYDNTEYRFFDWDNTDSAFVELTDMDAKLEAGDALWLITRDSRQLDVDNAFSLGIDTSRNVPVETGWNMISNPFAFNVNWSAVTDTIIQGGTAYYFEGTEWEFPVDIIEPYEGYAVYANSTQSLRVPAVEAPATKSFSAYDEWQIRIEAHTENWRDTYNFAGVRAGSDDKLDQADVFEPPSPSDHISLHFENRLAADYRQPGQEGYRFNFYVSGASKFQVAIKSESLPDHLGWKLVSPETHVKFDATDIALPPGSHELILLVGTEKFLEEELVAYKTIPDQFTLNQNFPNPFNPLTTIHYQLPQAAKVTIDIFDILGKRVISLKDGLFEQAGYHTIQWDGLDSRRQPVASGIYFFQLFSEKYVKTIKMILQK
jgi:hypothetical protein